MSVIDDLKESISALSDDKLMELVLEIRANRRVKKSKPTKKKSNVVDLNKLAGKLSPDMAKALLAQIEDSKK